MEKCYWKRVHPEAVIPSKGEPRARGYDLTLVAVKARFGLVTLYTTGLIGKPADGWCFDIVARSGIIKKGHLLVNGIGIVEADYRGEFMCALWKFDPSAPDLELPIKVTQVLVRPVEPDFEMAEDPDLDLNTARGAGGFGSTPS